MEATDSVVWEDPPGLTNGKGYRGVIAAALAPLRERPGHWARIQERDTSKAATNVAASITRGQYAGAARGEFRAVGRKVDGHFYVYACFIGDGS